MKAPSYKRANCCGDECVLLDVYDDQPCWGQVVVIGEDTWDNDWCWVHACEGHAMHREGVQYIPEPKEET